jgi:hypothetical protein
LCVPNNRHNFAHKKRKEKDEALQTIPNPVGHALGGIHVYGLP